MALDKDIVVMGDIHGDWWKLNPFINKKRPKIILCCGDFGYWPRIPDEQKNPKYPKAPKIPKVPDGSKLYFCDGNHEDHESLALLEDNEVYPNCFYMKRGSTLTLPDGRVVLFVGGAESIDKDTRTQGYDWFPQEELNYGDVCKILEAQIKADIVISHTAPVEFFYLSGMSWFGKMQDWSRKGLSHIFQAVQPSLWYCGHFHIYETGYTLGCRWTVLEHCRQNRWWEYLRC